MHENLVNGQLQSRYTRVRQPTIFHKFILIPLEYFSSVGKMLGYTDNFPGIEGPIRSMVALPQLTFPGWQVFVGYEWFANFRPRYRNIVDSDQ